MSWCSRVALGVSLTAGSTVLLGCGQPLAKSSFVGPTWYRDVLPIVSEHCASCHEAGRVGSVVLDFPAGDPEALERAKPVFADAVSVLDERFMPFWLADRACRSYEHERTVSDAERQVFRDFVGNGSQRGDPADAPPAFVSAPLARVDATLSPSAAYVPVAHAEGSTDTRCFVLDPALSAEKDVIGVELVPGSQRVHRAAIFAVQGAAVGALEQVDTGQGYACAGGPGLDAALVGEYVPGVPAQEYPAGTGIRLAAGSRLVLQVLYDLQTGDPVPDQSALKLEYADSLVAHPARFEAITNDSFSVPAHTTGFTAAATYPITQSTRVWGVAPHLGSYGRQVRMLARQAAGQSCLIQVGNWDPSWEQSYFFSSPSQVLLAPGDSVTVHCTWDNPGDVAVVSGTGTGDEACVGYAYLSED